MPARPSRILVCLGLMLASHAFAQAPAVKTTGIFSNLEYSEDSGDLGGMELFIFFAGEPKVLYQESIGEPVQPALVKATISGDSIEFTVPDVLGTSRTFKGKISKSGIVGKWVGSKDTIKLPRRKSYWQ